MNLITICVMLIMFLGFSAGKLISVFKTIRFCSFNQMTNPVENFDKRLTSS